MQLNANVKYGSPLQVNYTAALVENPKQVATSPIKATISKVWGIDGVTINNPLQPNVEMPADDVAKVQQTAQKLLTGAKGTIIDKQDFEQLAASLPGATKGLNSSTVYTTEDGNQYRYQYWLVDKDLAAANQGAKYGDPIKVTYSASLK